MRLLPRKLEVSRVGEGRKKERPLVTISEGERMKKALGRGKRGEAAADRIPPAGFPQIEEESFSLCSSQTISEGDGPVYASDINNNRLEGRGGEGRR